MLKRVLCEGTYLLTFRISCVSGSSAHSLHYSRWLQTFLAFLGCEDPLRLRLQTECVTCSWRRDKRSRGAVGSQPPCWSTPLIPVVNEASISRASLTQACSVLQLVPGTAPPNTVGLCTVLLPHCAFINMEPNFVPLDTEKQRMSQDNFTQYEVIFGKLLANTWILNAGV